MPYETILGELELIELVDPHTHIDPHAPAASSLADILGYHYYTELAHSAGLARERIEAEGISDREKVQRLAERLEPLRNTVQYSWLMQIAREFYDFDEPYLDGSNWEALFESVDRKSHAADWPDEILRQSRLTSVFLTNDFDDPLEGFDTTKYIPCLRTDDLVFHLSDESVRIRLAEATGVESGTTAQLRESLRRLFVHFKEHGAKACAISLPPDFEPRKVSASDADRVIAAMGRGKPVADEDRATAARYVFWVLAELCDEFRLPFDLMIGVHRSVYRAGVHQGRDLFDHRVSLIQYAELFNAFPQVTFAVSVLASTLNQELVSYAWIFPNVVTHGHWWYSNIPTYIEHDVAARLEAVPQSKQIAYYSDMYKLEFALPKFSMYRQALARVLSQRFVCERGWSEEAAVELGRRILRGNVRSVFGV